MKTIKIFDKYIISFLKKMGFKEEKIDVTSNNTIYSLKDTKDLQDALVCFLTCNPTQTTIKIVSCDYLNAFLMYNNIQPYNKVWNDGNESEEGYFDYYYKNNAEFKSALEIYKNKDLQVNLEIYTNCLCEVTGFAQQVREQERYALINK